MAAALGPKAILILFSTEPRVYTNDVDYEYRQENNLYYLTMLKQKRATLVLMPGNPQFLKSYSFRDGSILGSLDRSHVYRRGSKCRLRRQ